MSASLAPVRRTVVAGSIVAAALLGLGNLFAHPLLPDDPAAAADVLSTTPAVAIGMQLYVFSQLFWAIGLIGCAHLASGRSKVFALAAAALVSLGAFGHSVAAGMLLTKLALAATDPDAMVSAARASEGGIFAPYLLMGLVGTVIGLIMLAVALIRSRVTPLWVPIALLSWVLVEFVASGFVGWATYLSIVVGLIVYAGLALAVWRSDPSAWTTAAETSTPTAVPVGSIGG